jgi:endonuclease YncB( thermonuclease family)
MSAKRTPRAGEAPTGGDEAEAERPGQAKRQLAQALGKLAAVIILVLLVLLIEHYCQVQVPPFGPDAKITAIDGDSIRAGNGAEYRLYGIDAPELKQSCKEANGKSWLCGRAAKAKLTTLIKSGNVTCVDRGKDRYGRIVAVCSANGVPDLGQALVRDGYAISLTGKSGDPYAAEQGEARDAKRGIWRGSFEEPWQWREANPRVEGD